MKLRMGNKWRKGLNFVKCKDCDYLCQFEGADEQFCSNNDRKVSDPSIHNISKNHTCKFYFPRKNA